MEKKATKIRCSMCGAEFESQAELDRHNKTAHKK